jgi:hypothetical protein
MRSIAFFISRPQPSLCTHSNEPRPDLCQQEPTLYGRIGFSEMTHLFLRYPGCRNHHSSSAAIEVRPSEAELALSQEFSIVLNVLSHAFLLEHALVWGPMRSRAMKHGKADVFGHG